MKDIQNDKDLIWEEVECEHLVTDEWIDFRKSKYRFPDGSEFEPFYSYSRRDFVVILAQDEAGELICVRQYRQGIEAVTLEFCAGGIERTDGLEYRRKGAKIDDAKEAEAALEAAKRELAEETGYESDDWTHLLTVPSNPTIADNYAILFVAKNCKKVAGQSLDDTEFLNVVKLSPKELESRITSGSFQQPIHILAWYMSKMQGVI